MRIVRSCIIIVLIVFCIDRIIGFVINRGLCNYFGLQQHSEVLIIGHSHLMLAMDKSNFEKEIGLGVSKYCREGVGVIDREYMINQYLDSRYSDSLQFVLYGVDQFMFNIDGLSKNSYKLFYPFIDEKNMNNYIYSSTNWLDYITHKVICSTRYSDALINSSIRGWLKNWDNYKFGQLCVAQLEKDISNGAVRHICPNAEVKHRFEETLKLLQNRGIKVILINTPVADPLNKFEASKYNDIVNYFKRLADNSEQIFFWDFNPEYSSRYDLFFDPIHLNRKGQQVINAEIVRMFNKCCK